MFEKFQDKVVPTIAVLTVAYPTAFLGTMWFDAIQGGARVLGEHVATGEIRGGWRYEIYQREWPRTYTIDLAQDQPGAKGRLCALEVRGKPRPTRVIPGEGAAVYVTFEEPLKGETTASLRINLLDADHGGCAATVADGAVMKPDRLQYGPALVRNGLPGLRETASAPAAELRGGGGG
jgi:hypothetical protein